MEVGLVASSVVMLFIWLETVAHGALAQVLNAAAHRAAARNEGDALVAMRRARVRAALAPVLVMLGAMGVGVALERLAAPTGSPSSSRWATSLATAGKTLAVMNLAGVIPHGWSGSLRLTRAVGAWLLPGREDAVARWVPLLVWIALGALAVHWQTWELAVLCGVFACVDAAKILRARQSQRAAADARVARGADG
ncbi:hypothetical protein [Sorangium sp. So ce854]|uniref:hypothetical protein n=1 Tax=Sorangium sp. So ce854 TaxID=3133322 RepID=UPI003F619F79